MSTRKTVSKKRPASKSSKKTSAKSPKSPKTKATSSRRSTASKTRSAGKEEVTVDRRSTSDRRTADEGNAPAKAAPPVLERRKKVNRRRQIDPTTCERDYTEAEVEFMNALDEYKRKSGRMFPTCSEVLEVVRGLGYVKLSPSEMAACDANAEGKTDATPDDQPTAIPTISEMAGGAFPELMN